MDSDDPTRRVPIQPQPSGRGEFQPEPSASPALVCSTCGWPNLPDRRRCERCAAVLAERPTPPVAPPPPGGRSGPRWWLIAIPVAAVIAVLVLAVLLFLLPRAAGPAAGPSPTTQPEPTSAPGSLRLLPVDSTTVRASASSVLPPVAPATFVAENTLDGDLTTAWNSNGEAAPGAGTTLTYQFAEPVRLGRVDLANGYQAGAEEYARNARVKTLTVTTDEAQRTFNIGDSKGFQQLEFDFGTTGQVTFRIDETYAGSTYKDIAISEVVFHRLGQ